VEVAALAEAVALAGARTPFVLATVVWRRAPSSGQVGAKALILADGTVHGWMGGACAEPTVVREARAALQDGRPRLLFLGQPDELDQRAEAGMLTVPMACESEGAIEVYLEPYLPAPQVVVMGRSPAVATLAALVPALGWEVVVLDDGQVDLAGLGIGPSSAIVVATQGHYDDLALDAALGTDAGYVGLVASAKRAATVLELLRDRGLGDDQLARVIAPAGLDLGAVSNPEIAVAILAELVSRRASGQLVDAPLVTAVEEAVDPVCGMTVDPRVTRYQSVFDGRDFWFCAPGCKAAFDADPAAYV
jgi:xanthine dehydrogenase accessory factor